MKRSLMHFVFVLASLFMLASTTYSQSGWVRQHPPSQAQKISFLSVSFVDANTGFIVGGYGTILHTTNGGTDWISQLSGTMNWLRGVSAADSDTAVAVGDSGIILHTTNGGTTWMNQSSGTAHTLRAVCFIDASTGAVVGDSGTILRTTNGGATWMNQSSGTLSNLNSVSFINASTGTVVGNSGTMMHTTNGGTTWTNQSISADYQLLGVSLTDADTGIVVGNYQGCVIIPCNENGPVIIGMTNGGILWNAKPPDTLFLICKDCLPDFIGAVSFTDVNTGTVAVYNCIFHTTNGGGASFTDSVKEGEGSWIPQLADTNVYQGVCFTDANHGTVVGAFGIILHTTTGGITAVKNSPAQVSDEFSLEQNYPNPFNPGTVISYNLAISSLVTMKVYDILGRQVQTLVNERQSAGNHSVTFSAASLPSGVYFYRLEAGTYHDTKKLVLLK